MCVYMCMKLKIYKLGIFYLLIRELGSNLGYCFKKVKGEMPIVMVVEGRKISPPKYFGSLPC